MPRLEFKDPTTTKIVNFLLEIGLEVKPSVIDEATFLPGILIGQGVILVDEEKLKHPGDLLHEAGHLAVMPGDKRKRVQKDAGKKAAEEIMAIAWSYAALVHLELEPTVVFHADGYRGDSQSLIENFTEGRTFGQPTLQWLGMTAEKKLAEELGIEPYPHMIKWLRD
ncbi:MAG: hypothetical protein ACM3Y8_07165 [Byssovorax cruenta]|jgi:hypothetical protein